jgi:hypothetical protein
MNYTFVNDEAMMIYKSKGFRIPLSNAKTP